MLNKAGGGKTTEDPYSPQYPPRLETASWNENKLWHVAFIKYPTLHIALLKDPENRWIKNETATTQFCRSFFIPNGSKWCLVVFGDRLLVDRKKDTSLDPCQSKFTNRLLSAPLGPSPPAPGNGVPRLEPPRRLIKRPSKWTICREVIEPKNTLLMVLSGFVFFKGLGWVWEVLPRSQRFKSA